jgi:hypothetical protein
VRAGLEVTDARLQTAEQNKEAGEGELREAATAEQQLGEARHGTPLQGGRPLPPELEQVLARLR